MSCSGGQFLAAVREVGGEGNQALGAHVCPIEWNKAEVRKAKCSGH